MDGEVLTKRDIAKSKLDRGISTLKRRTTERDIAGVKTCLIEVKGLMEAFENLHYAYLDVETDDKVASKAITWFEKVLDEYLKAVTKANTWLTGVGEETNLNPSVPAESKPARPATSSDSELASLLNMPRLQVPVFSGSNPLEYKVFITLFDQVFANALSDDQAKLARLLQCLSGDALRSVQACVMLEPAKGYTQARETLSQRFGNSQLVAQTIANDLRRGKKISKAVDLRKLSDDLIMAQRTLQSLAVDEEVNTQGFIHEVIDRCPSQVKARWRQHALDHKEKKSVYPSFENLSDFIKKEANRACDPVYGYHDVRSGACNVIAEDSAELSGSPQGCYLCSGKHALVSCNRFKKMSVSQRLNFAREKRLCFLCLAGRHNAGKCSKGVSCGEPGCRYKHHRLLHASQTQDQHSSDHAGEVGNPASSGPDVSVTSTANVGSVGERVCLPVVPVIVKGCVVYALLDSGSTCSLVTADLCRRLGIRGRKMARDVKTVSGSSTWTTELVDLVIEPLDGGGRYTLKDVMSVSDIPAEMPSSRIDLSCYSHLKDINFRTPEEDTPVSILIGMNHPDLIAPIQVRRSQSNSRAPYATKTKLGWVLQGPLPTNSSVNQVSVNNIQSGGLERQIENLWKLEASDEDLLSESVEDREVISLWEREIQFQEGHYELPIPWKAGDPNMPNNRYLAERRLDSTIKKLERNSNFKEYDEGMKKMLSEGYAEPVPDEDLPGQPGRVWYVPHHAVVHPVKKKIRIVFDCAAKYLEVSLNNQCLQGPDLINKLLHVLLRFRQYECAVTADIQAMYMQVKIPLKDRDCLRYLWVQNGEIREFRSTSHLFGGVWSGSAASYALHRAVNDNECSDLVRTAVMRDMYVDDMLKSLTTVELTRELICGSKEVLAEGGFNLTKFTTNVPEVLEGIPEEDRAQESKVITPQTMSKALGLNWNVYLDQFEYRPFEGSIEPLTRRGILSQVAAMYDPIGVACPVVLAGRLIFQESTRMQLDWDDPVPASIALRWQVWVQSLSDLSSLSFPRCLVPTRFLDGAMELHHFSDSSQVAYGSCTYLRIMNASGEVRVSLLLAKGRVAPLKGAVTIPRLELCAAVLSVRHELKLRRELTLDLLPSVFWTDSQIVLAYIKSTSRRFKVFVGNRVSFIRDHTDVDQWKFVPTSLNAADILSRGCVPSAVPAMWLHGPEFLSCPKHEWPDFQGVTANLDGDCEVKCATLVVGASKEVEHPLDRMISHYSSYYRLKKAVAWLIRALRCLRSRAGCQDVLSVSEMQHAEILLVRHVQRSVFCDELLQLRSQGKVQRSSPLISLRPVLRDDLLCVGGRLKHSPLQPSAKWPMILPSNHPLTVMILRDFHEQFHLGVEWLASLIRRKFWVPRLRVALRGLRAKCVTCKKLYDSPMHQVMAELPPDRCTPSGGPFTNVGVDLCGPFYVKVGRATVKRYCCVFTCLTTRAVHLEVLCSLETDSFINGLVRFCARRGYPSVVRSDNGTNLVGCQAELAREFKSLDRAKVCAEARRKSIEWIFNPPYSSSQGGVWERVIRTIRRVMLAIHNPSVVTSDEVLVTVFCEVEAVVNSRPLTKLSESPMDMEPLTPNHFLLARSSPSLPWTSVAKNGELRHRWRMVQTLMDAFWRRYLREYLPELQRRTKWKYEQRDLAVGDLVLVADESSPRGLWPLGLVLEVREGRDGHVRSVRLKTRFTTMVRPITKLIYLESFPCDDDGIGPKSVQQGAGVTDRSQ